MIQKRLNYGIASKVDVMRERIKFNSIQKELVKQQNLQLNINKAQKYLKWKPTYNIRNSVKMTIDWYFRVLEKKENPDKVTSDHIDQYTHDSKKN